MIKNKEEFKNYNIVCINDKEIKECFDLLEKLGFKTDKRLLATFSVFINFNETQNIFLNTKKLESNFDKNITFYEFKKLAKKFLKKEKEKLEDFEVANDGRITKINNWKSGKKVFLIYGYDNIVDGFVQSLLETYIKLGIAYATEETRDKAQFKMEIETKLKNIAERLNNGKKIDWEDGKQEKYFLCYDCTTEMIVYQGSCYYYCYGNIYCLSRNFLDEAIKEIGEDNLIKYFKD